MTPADQTPRNEGGGVDPEQLYDRYLEAALQGHSEDPAAYCARHGLEGAELEQWLLALEGILGGRAELGASVADAAQRAQSAEDGLPYATLDEYRLIRRLGEGGMGEVFLAEQQSLGRLVALKVMRRELVGSSSAAVRFRREALAVAGLRHPSIVTIYAVGEQGGIDYIAMELLPGKSLSEVLAEAGSEGAPIPTRKLLGWMVQIADALAYAHGEGIIHRDIKPSNIRVTPTGRALLIDFGLARAAGNHIFTVTGQFAGSPAYASPEQVDSKRRDVDARTDIYSLGITLYECLAGRLPFKADSVERIFHAILSVDPVPLRQLNPGLSKDLEVVVGQALEKDADRRYQSSAEFAADLRSVLELRPISARPPGPLIRASKWARRNRTATAVLVFALLVLITSGVLMAFSARQERLRLQHQKQQASAWLDDAVRLITAHQVLAREAVDAFQASSGFRRMQQWYHLDEQQRAQLCASDELVESYPLESERLFGDVMRRLSRAQELDPEIDISRPKALLYGQKWYEAGSRGDWDLAEVYRSMSADRDGRVSFPEGADSQGTVSFSVDPPNAEVHLFRLRRHASVVRGGEQRTVPCALRGATALVPPGTWALRIVRPAGELERSDLIVEVAGQPIEGSVLVLSGNERIAVHDRLVAVNGVEVRDRMEVGLRSEGPGPHEFEFETAVGRRTVEAHSLAALGILLGDPRMVAERGQVAATVVRRGQLIRTTLPVGLELRTTAAPLVISEATRVAVRAGEPIRLEFGPHLALILCAGFEPQRVPFEVRYDKQPSYQVSQKRLGSSIPGFVYVGCDAITRDQHPGFWIMEREVWSGEYVEFLNDPVTARELDTAESLIRAPRDQAVDGSVSLWEQGSDGTYRLPDGWDERTPVLGISWQDATAFVRWKNEHADALPPGYRYALPNFHEWIQAGSGGGTQQYVHGDTFRPQWIKSRMSREIRVREPGLSFPIDESTFGVFDLAGGAAEWLDVRAFSNGEERALGGGSWLHFQPADFRIDHRDGVPEYAAAPSFGFRLVITAVEGRR